MNSEPNRRRRQPASDRLTRRKRVVVACEFCRIRKTRCDGVKPVCGFCERHEARCVWGSALEGVESTESTPAECEILHRLDEIKTLLNASAASQRSIPTAPFTGAPPSFPAIRCESILRWPIYYGLVDPSDASIESFVLECAPASGYNSDGPPGAIGQEHLLVPLCRKFLAHVHARNPILEGPELIQYAKHVTEHGLGWDGNSCLVLIACALASYTCPWEEAVTDQPSPVLVQEHTEHMASAEAFYAAAKKRFGLLNCSLVDIQCFFFASVYEKYAFGPLQAWLHVQSASVRLQTHLKRQQRMNMLHNGSIAELPEQKLVRRAFWSVYKAESELLMELPLKSTGIDDYVQTGSLFPTPPNIPTQSEEAHETYTINLQSWEEERSWFFYTAEISLRRTFNDMLWLLFRKGESYWLTHNASIEMDHQEIQRQITAWYTHLPSSIQFKPDEPAGNEHAFYLQGRFFEWRACALRPFLYYALHRPAGQEMSQLTKSYAEEHLSICMNGIMYHRRHHRHGGTWFACRRSFAYALCILAVVVKGDGSLPPPTGWHSVISDAIATLIKWEAQSADVQAMRQVLERIFRTVCARVGVAS